MKIRVENRPLIDFSAKARRRGRPKGTEVYPFRHCDGVGDSFFVPCKRERWASSIVSRYNKLLAPWVFRYAFHEAGNETKKIRGIMIQRVA